jgi:hypothetical protein
MNDSLSREKLVVLILSFGEMFLIRIVGLDYFELVKIAKGKTGY